ncbi:FUSC family protein [Saccharomonospora halophila]|uniref:FUSC family protein n=1 Tax=Saccharomonospora halophila TaxID=129922 RepID=UPI00036BC983|nr:aromatic acid exporter family protein [Saccharomonospora halophila]
MIGSVRDRIRGRGPELLRRVRSSDRHVLKSTLAATGSFALAGALGTSDAPVLAPLTALIVVQVTLFQTLTIGIQRVASVVSGVLLAVGVAGIVGLTWWSIGSIVGAALLVGLVLRLGPQMNEAAISAMLLLAVGGASDVAIERVYETLVGAAVGVLVNVVVPPVHLRPAGEALMRLTDRMAEFTTSLAAELRPSWSQAKADRWLTEARSLVTEVGRTDQALARAEEGARGNPRGRVTQRRQPRLRTALTGLERCLLALRELCRTLLDRTYFVPEEDEGSVYGDDVRGVLADLLESSAGAIRAVGELATSVSDAGVENHLPEIAECRERLSALLVNEPLRDIRAWEHHGALLSAVDRLRTEIESATRFPDQPWKPPPVTEQQREIVRRLRRERRPLRRDDRNR